MSDFIFTDYTPECPARPMIESRRVFDVRDPHWGHPEFRVGWLNPKAAATTDAYLPETPIEAKRAANEAYDVYYKNAYASGKMVHTCDIERVTVPGCPEEPETSVDVLVYRPKGLAENGNPALMYCMGGGLVLSTPDFCGIEKLCDEFKCVAIVPLYRLAFDAKYPAAVNDCHAAYQWALDNADALAIDADNFVLTGNSSGAQLALNMGFRLKRYGITPKGIVAVLPQTDDRTDSNIYSGSWDSVAQRNALTQWLGDNSNSNFIGPEALANKATVSDCVGYAPCFIHTVEFDPDRDENREFYGKLLKARSYAEYHAWGGAMHETVGLCAAAILNGFDALCTPYSYRFRDVVWGNIRDCYQYDLRRPWVVEDLEEEGPWW